MHSLVIACHKVVMLGLAPILSVTATLLSLIAESNFSPKLPACHQLWTYPFYPHSLVL